MPTEVACGVITESEVPALDGELITYCALATRLRPRYGTIAMACSVVVELTATGPIPVRIHGWRPTIRRVVNNRAARSVRHLYGHRLRVGSRLHREFRLQRHIRNPGARIHILCRDLHILLGLGVGLLRLLNGLLTGFHRLLSGLHRLLTRLLCRVGRGVLRLNDRSSHHQN